MDLDKYFVKSELIPAVIQEHGTKKVLMLAYMKVLCRVWCNSVKWVTPYLFVMLRRGSFAGFLGFLPS